MTGILEDRPATWSSEAKFIRSEQFAVLNEARPVGQFIVERTRRHIVFLGQPVDSAGACSARDFLDLFDERRSDSFAARVRSNEQILKIAIVALGPARTMVEVMHNADHLSVKRCSQQMHRFN